MRRLWALLAFFFLFNVIGFGYFFLNIDRAFSYDWDSYFNSLSLFVRSAVWKYHEVPLYNPWRCGGSDFLTNPQTRILSPMGLLDVFLAPQWANTLTLFFYALAGNFGALAAFRALGFTTRTAIVGALLFANSSWLALHFVEGHIVYAQMQLIPFFFWLGLGISEKRKQLALGLVVSLLVLDGAIQAVIYGGLVTAIAVFYAGRKRIDWKHFGLVLLGVVLLLSAKIVPVKMTLQRGAQHETNVMSPKLLFHALLDPIQSNRLDVANGTPLFFHEYGCYLGWSAVLLILFAVATGKMKGRASRFFALAAVFFFWIGTGWGRSFNPWWLWQRIPVLAYAHIQSRMFILMAFFFVALVLYALRTLESRKTAWWAVAVLLCLETGFVRLHVTKELALGTTPAAGWNDWIESTTIRDTVVDGMPVKHYLEGNKNALQCNDRAFIVSGVLANDDPLYKGIAQVTDNQGAAQLVTAKPNELTFLYDVKAPADVILNANHFWGWASDRPGVKVVSNHVGDRIRVSVPQGKGVVTLRYTPSYWWAFLLSLAGAGILFALSMRTRHP